MPGKSLLAGLPYFFDEVFVMNLGKLEDGSIYRYLQTGKTLAHEDCKDRSGRLEMVEKPDLTYIFGKIAQPQEKETKQTKTKEN